MGNRHLRRETRTNGTAAYRSRSVAASSANAAPVAPAAPKVEVTPEECCKLAADLAYFKACIHREASPGEIRKDDIEGAEKDIIAVTGRTQ